MPKDKTRKIIETAIIAVMSAATGYGISIHFSGIGASYNDNYIAPLTVTSLLVFAAVFILLYLLLHFLNKYRANICFLITAARKNSLSEIKFFIIVFSGLILFWLPYLFSFATASVLADSLASVSQILSGCYDNHFPIVYTLIVGVFVRIGLLFGNINIGIFGYACFQFLVLAFVCASILTWLYAHGVKPLIVIIAALFYAVFPAFPAYAITMWKDPLFSVALAVLSFIILKEKTTWYQLLLSMAAVFFLRSNGLVILAVLGIIMLISKNRRKGGIVCLVSLALFIAGSNALLNGLKAERCTEEALGIPLQQMAYTVVYDYDNLTDSEIEAIDNIIPIDTLKEVYSPCLVDSVKWNEEFNKEYVRENASEVLSLWAEMLPKHLDSYIKAYALETYGFWMPHVQNDYGYIDLYIYPNDIGIVEKDLFKSIFGVSIKDTLKSFKPYIGSGTLVWIAFLDFMLCMLTDKKKCWFYAPGLLCWLSVMLSTPVAFSLRYVFILLLLLPVYTFLPFIDFNRNQEIKSAGVGV